MTHSRCLALALAAIVAVQTAATMAVAREYPIGIPQTGGKMEVGAAYTRPMTMVPAGTMRPAAVSDIHLEADIHGLADNPTGLAEGEWAPYLVIHYTLKKAGDATVLSGTLMPMVANDGYHYGDNVKLLGLGKYTLRLNIAPPTANPDFHFSRNIDKKTGVGPWFTRFSRAFNFDYTGVDTNGSD